MESQTPINTEPKEEVHSEEPEDERPEKTPSKEPSTEYSDDDESTIADEKPVVINPPQPFRRPVNCPVDGSELDKAEEDLKKDEEEHPEESRPTCPQDTEVLDPHDVWKTLLEKSPAEELLECDFNKCKFEHFIEEMPKELPLLQLMSCPDAGLKSLETMPFCPRCHTVDLSGNDLHAEEIILIKEKTPYVEQLNLCGNQINTFEDLDKILEIKTLLTLDLYENGVVNLKGYREHVFERLPNLRYLDGYDKDNNEIDLDSSNASDFDEDGEEFVTDSELDDDEIPEREDEEESSEEEEDHIPLSYLDSSKCLEDEDDSEDFKDPVELRKRKAVGGGEPQAKQVKSDPGQEAGASTATKQEPAEANEA